MSAESPKSFHIATQRSKSKDADGKFATIARIDGQRVEGDGNAAVIVEFETGLKTFFEQLPRRGVIALSTRQNCGGEEQTGTEFRTRRAFLPVPAAWRWISALRKMFPRFPETKQGGAKAEAPVGIPGFDKIIERHAEVIVLDFKTVEPFGVSNNILGAFFGKHQVISGMGAASCRFIIAFGQAFESVFPDGGEHQESRFRIGLLHLLRQLLSTMEAMPSSTSRPRSPLVSHTASTPSSVHPPVNTASLRKRVCSAELSSP